MFFPMSCTSPFTVAKTTGPRPAELSLGRRDFSTSKAAFAASAAIAAKAIPQCNLVCITGSDMAPTIDGYYNVLFEANPKSVGGSLPDDSFYYVP